MAFLASPTELTLSKSDPRAFGMFALRNKYNVGIKYWIVPPNCLYDPAPIAPLCLPANSERNFIIQPRSRNRPETDEIWIRYQLYHFYFFERIYTIKVKVTFEDDELSSSNVIDGYSLLNDSMTSTESWNSDLSYINISTLRIRYTESETFRIFSACSHCLIRYDSERHAPRVLRCGHTLCHGCAVRIAKESKKGRLIKCPFGEDIVTVLGKHVDELPVNFILMDILGVAGTRPIRRTEANNEEQGNPAAHRFQ